VEEVVISKKLNCRGNRFGFVRFCNVKNVPRLESELDSICIGVMKLFVNIPRYWKVESHKPVSSAPRSTKALELKPKVVKKWIAKVGEQSMANVSKSEWKGYIINIAPLKLPWLEGSWVGFTEEFVPLELVCEELLQEGLGSLRARYLGDNQVLLTGQDGVKTSVIVEGSRERLGKIFKAIEPWNGGKVADIKPFGSAVEEFLWLCGLRGASGRSFLMWVHWWKWMRPRLAGSVLSMQG